MIFFNDFFYYYKMSSFTLLQWNTLCKILSDKEAFPYADEKSLIWENREPMLREIIDKIKADIICLEEVGNFNTGFKTEILDKCSIKYDLIFEERASKIMGNVLGVNKELFEIENYENLFLDEEVGKPGGINIISAIIKDKKTNNKFVVIVVHLKAKEKFENVRIVQMDHLMRYIEEKFLKKYPIFILGDFNAEPTYQSILNLMANDKIKPKSLFDLKTLDFTTIKLRDVLYRRIIDYIFFVGKNPNEIEKELKIISCDKGRPELDEKIGLPNNVFPSDHVYLQAKVELNYI